MESKIGIGQLKQRFVLKKNIFKRHKNVDFLMKNFFWQNLKRKFYDIGNIEDKIAAIGRMTTQLHLKGLSSILCR